MGVRKNDSPGATLRLVAYATIKMARNGNRQPGVNGRGMSSRQWPGERVIMRRDERLNGDGDLDSIGSVTRLVEASEVLSSSGSWDVQQCSSEQLDKLFDL